jgi:hypothetical protein
VVLACYLPVGVDSVEEVHLVGRPLLNDLGHLLGVVHLVYSKLCLLGSGTLQSYVTSIFGGAPYASEPPGTPSVFLASLGPLFLFPTAQGTFWPSHFVGNPDTGELG